LIADLDRIFDSPVLARGLIGVRIESLRTGETLYERNGARLVVPASNMKLLTLSVAAERLGWTHRFETRLESAGSIANGTLTGDLVVVGSGDPSVVAQDFTHAPLFLEWADALRAAGIRRVTGRLIGDDNAFDDESLGAGWAWDYLTAAYAAPSGALSYNENVVAVRITPAKTAGDAALVELAPPGARPGRRQCERRRIADAGQLAARSQGYGPGRRQRGHARHHDRQPDEVLRRGTPAGPPFTRDRRPRRRMGYR
jgi:D-alanyl-D-alanine carboxypeptidase/D-alanyl-D-alanine-endopeptidase (penicillin-binding protein 4)